jgi:hypothetical protein
VKSITINVRKYGSQVIAMCHPQTLTEPNDSERDDTERGRAGQGARDPPRRRASEDGDKGQDEQVDDVKQVELLRSHESPPLRRTLECANPHPHGSVPHSDFLDSLREPVHVFADPVKRPCQPDAKGVGAATGFRADRLP